MEETTLRFKPLEPSKAPNLQNYAEVATCVEHLAKNWDYQIFIKDRNYEAEIRRMEIQVQVLIDWNNDGNYRTYEGIASEVEGGPGANRNSATENCYTSAVGKALKAAGIGLHTTASVKKGVLKMSTANEIRKDNNQKVLERDRLEEAKKHILAFLEKGITCEDYIARAKTAYQLSDESLDLLRLDWVVLEEDNANLKKEKNGTI